MEMEEETGWGAESSPTSSRRGREVGHLGSHGAEHLRLLPAPVRPPPPMCPHHDKGGHVQGQHCPGENAGLRFSLCFPQLACE